MIGYNYVFWLRVDMLLRLPCSIWNERGFTIDEIWTCAGCSDDSENSLTRNCFILWIRTTWGEVTYRFPVFLN